MSPGNRQAIYDFEFGNAGGMVESQLSEASRRAAEWLEKKALVGRVARKSWKVRLH
jgi:hypothetical protein